MKIINFCIFILDGALCRDGLLIPVIHEMTILDCLLLRVNSFCLFQKFMPIVSFSCFTSMTTISIPILNANENNGHLSLTAEFDENALLLHY